MKIGLDVAQTCVERAGCAWHADGLSRALIAAGLPLGHTFELYHHFGDWINHEPFRGTFVSASGVSAPLRTMNPAEARKFWREIESGEPLPGKPDVVLSFSFHAPKLPHTKLVYTVHDLVFWAHPEFCTDATRLLCQRELLQALSRAAGFLFVSDNTRRDFEQFLPGWLDATQRPHALSPGASRFPRADAPRLFAENSPWLIVGSLEPRKNHACILDAYEHYLATSPQRRPLVVAGGAGWKSEELHSRLADAGASVRHLGYVSDAELAELYRAAFALLVPSWHEGFGLPLVEAFTAGLPAIASNRASLPEVAAAAAPTFAPDNPHAWAAEMLCLEIDSTLYSRRAAAALTRSHDFSWESTATSVLDFIARL